MLQLKSPNQIKIAIDTRVESIFYQDARKLGRLGSIETYVSIAKTIRTGQGVLI